MNPARREPLGVERKIANDVAREPLCVGLVVDAEASWIAEQVGVRAQDSHARGVEGADPHVLGRAADKVGDALFHLASGLVGEGDCEDALRMHALTVDEMGNAMGEHARLARACSRHHE